MKLRFFTLTASAVIVLAAPLCAELREFHDRTGRPLKAELVKARGPNVVIRDAAGKETPVPLKNFSRDDIGYISRWIAAEPSALDYRFDLKEVEKVLSSVPTAGRPTGLAAYGTAEESQRGYELSLSNRCQNPVEGVRACYRVFLIDCVDEYSLIRGARKLLFKSGHVELPTLTYNGSYKFTTRAHTLHKIKAQNSYYGVNEKDRLRGVWVRFFRHGAQVAEWKSGTVPRCEWPESESEKEALAVDKENQKQLVAALTAPPAPATPDKPVPSAIPPKTVKKPKKIEDKDVAEEIKIFDLEDVMEKPGAVPPLTK